MNLELIAEARRVMRDAELLYDGAQLQQRLLEMAAELNQQLADEVPVALCVMNGGLMIAGHLLPLLTMPLELDYIHATRYRNTTLGGELVWKRRHEISIRDRIVLVLDDILDEGETLRGIQKACMDEGARQVIRVVMVEKIHDRNPDVIAEYVGMQVPDRYVFGFGMDYKGFWRNSQGIYAVKEEE
jgi:hypoxanthine phosphoribosyltransferase